MNSKLCECGCKQPTGMAKVSDRRSGLVKGKPLRFLSGHQGRKNKRYEVDPKTECWNWLLSKTKTGYGMVYLKNYTQKSMTAHRWQYQQAHGPLPDFIQLDHRCRNRACVNPDHLEPVSAAENTRRGINTKLTLTDVKAIRAAHVAGVSNTELGHQYGIAQPAICNIVNGKRWLDRLYLQLSDVMCTTDGFDSKTPRLQRKRRHHALGRKLQVRKRRSGHRQ